MRHGNGFSSWWKQERQDMVTTQCASDEYIFELLQTDTTDYFFCQKIYLYVREVKSTICDFWRMKFFESMGGKTHVQCKCCDFPLIPTNNQKHTKTKCNFNKFVQQDGHIQEKMRSCNRTESFICSNICCDIKICRRCYNQFPKDVVTVLIPEQNINISGNNSDEDNNDDADDNSTVITDHSDRDEVEQNMINHVTYEEQDPTLDLTEDNINIEIGFATTNAADIGINKEQDLTTDTVSGHVIFNQAGSCLNRGNCNIHGTSRQSHLIQSLCATIPGTASPLLQPEASLFPRHFYIAAQHDSISILGARPLFLYNNETCPY